MTFFCKVNGNKFTTVCVTQLCTFASYSRAVTFVSNGHWYIEPQMRSLFIQLHYGILFAHSFIWHGNWAYTPTTNLLPIRHHLSPHVEWASHVNLTSGLKLQSNFYCHATVCLRCSAHKFTSRGLTKDYAKEIRPNISLFYNTNVVINNKCGSNTISIADQKLFFYAKSYDIFSKR